LNPFLDKDALFDKASVLDVKARTESGTLIDVEIQLWNHRDMEKRTLYYWAKLFESQLKEGDSYWKLHKAVTINVLDFDYIPTDRYHTTFHLREDVTGLLLTDLLEIHFVELRKLREQAVGLERRLVRWMLFLTAKSRESLEGLAMQDPAIKKALTTLEFLSQDEEARRLYEERMKGLQTYMAEIHGAKEEGRKEGREEGRKEGDRNARKEVAKKLLQMGLTIEQVVESTSLSREEVEAIRKELLQ
ncbi:MAG: Rpn family recombination-promoting nuclease/putative transposase, partial [Alicyclobacillaceae bacterium]|nr:Rpn family recombination-promoting nuclease/putative transposase [Alicyclobacillaceae bacterium]